MVDLKTRARTTQASLKLNKRWHTLEHNKRMERESSEQANAARAFSEKSEFLAIGEPPSEVVCVCVFFFQIDVKINQDGRRQRRQESDSFLPPISFSILIIQLFSICFYHYKS